MGYSITPQLHHYEKKDGTHNIVIQVIYQRIKVYQKTEFSVSKKQIKNGKIINHPHAKVINKALGIIVNDIEKNILSTMDGGERAILASTEDLRVIIDGEKTTNVRFCDFVKEILPVLNLSLKRHQLYKQISRFIVETYGSGVLLSQFTIARLQEIESTYFNLGLDQSTVSGKMSAIKAILNRGVDRGYIEEKQFKKYVPPKYKQKIPEYLVEKEIDKFYIATKKLGGVMKIAGYYFLLSCYAGYRASDLMSFDYERAVTDDRVMLRAQKNKNIVSLKIYPKLKQVLDFIKQNKFPHDVSKLRMHVKAIAQMAGVKKNVKLHTGRHSFAMLMLKKGFSIDDISYLIGDTPTVTKIYARMNNEIIDKKVDSLLI